MAELDQKQLLADMLKKNGIGSDPAAALRYATKVLETVADWYRVVEPFAKHDIAQYEDTAGELLSLIEAIEE
jgi:hypothetical protein